MLELLLLGAIAVCWIAVYIDVYLFRVWLEKQDLEKDKE